MKRISLVIVSLVLYLAPAVHAQDATEQRLNELSGKLESLLADQEAQRKRMDALAREIRTLQEQQSAPTSYASQDDLKRLADGLREVDRKRLDDYEKIRAELLKLGKTLAPPPPSALKKRPEPATEESTATEKPTKPEVGYEYVVEKDDTLSRIVQRCRDKGVKVTVDQIQKANPKMKPEKLYVGQRLFIPAPEAGEQGTDTPDSNSKARHTHKADTRKQK